MKAHRIAAAVVAAAVIIVGGIASASIPAADGTIRGCYTNKTGALRVIDGGACKSTETSMNWNQTGPPGPPGSNAIQIVRRVSPSQIISANGGSMGLTAYCWPGETVVGGGYGGMNGGIGYISGSHPFVDGPAPNDGSGGTPILGGNGWAVEVRNDSQWDIPAMHAYALCVPGTVTTYRYPA